MSDVSPLRPTPSPLVLLVLLLLTRFYKLLIQAADIIIVTNGSSRVNSEHKEDFSGMSVWHLAGGGGAGAQRLDLEPRGFPKPSPT